MDFYLRLNPDSVKYKHYFDNSYHIWFEKQDLDKNYSVIRQRIQDYEFFSHWINKTREAFRWNILNDNSEEAINLRNLLQV